MGRLLKYLFRLIVLAALALVGYALFGDLDAPRAPVSLPLETPAAGQ
ncbi:hypothetical protein H0I76_04450 [Limibaculum sp. M0105]|uniref:Uncharacterized protein n=1 Tax=Thermohalobaculum xanthum TaxID=2753746 RepID=A0A8J7M660_9RHOB|nr:hypothetical protein [Thermohalobaculum xanthum]MBK0398430.1 hypothetical protein [Thermohalobaculum xanthum]